MAQSRSERLVAGIRANAWWVGPPLVIALVLGFVVGWPLMWVGYVVLNSAGVWLYADHHGSRRPRRQLWMKGLAIVLVPTGMLGLFGSGGGMSATEAAGAASDDEGIRKAAARTPNPPMLP
ncbi:MAG: hypothetical protein ACR2QE_00635 [Acidimicrobiales bacterium]